MVREILFVGSCKRRTYPPNTPIRLESGEEDRGWWGRDDYGGDHRPKEVRVRVVVEQKEGDNRTTRHLPGKEEVGVIK